MIAPILIIVGIFVDLGVISIIAKSSKKAKEEDKKQQGSERMTKMLEEKEDFKKFLDYESSSSQKPAPSRVQQSAPQQQRRREEVRPIATQVDGRVQAKATQKHTFNTIQPRVDVKKEVSGSHHQSHCDTQHEGDKYRVEYVPTMNSIGGTSTEGCREHYNTRYVKIDEKIQENLQLTPLQKIIVYGEVINKPKFRR